MAGPEQPFGTDDPDKPDIINDPVAIEAGMLRPNLEESQQIHNIETALTQAGFPIREAWLTALEIAVPPEEIEDEGQDSVL